MTQGCSYTSRGFPPPIYSGWNNLSAPPQVPKMAQLEHIEAIEKRLWSAADTLRANSNYASNEYFLPVMGLVFLRHAYSRFLPSRMPSRRACPHAAARPGR
jgi:hypothetical protein